MTEKDKLYADELRNKAISDYERLDHAINELERQTCETPRKNLSESSQDCISREEIRNIIIKDNEMYGYSDRTHDLMEKILELPPVTPSYNSIKTELKPCEDCISREAAIDVVRKWFDKMQLNGDICLDGIISLPSVTPSIQDVENNFNLGYNCGYADAMSDISESSESEREIARCQRGQVAKSAKRIINFTRRLTSITRAANRGTYQSHLRESSSGFLAFLNTQSSTIENSAQGGANDG